MIALRDSGIFSREELANELPYSPSTELVISLKLYIQKFAILFHLQHNPQLQKGYALLGSSVTVGFENYSRPYYTFEEPMALKSKHFQMLFSDFKEMGSLKLYNHKFILVKVCQEPKSN